MTKGAAIATMLILMAAPAAAGELTEACQAAVSAYTLSKEVKIAGSQEFANLTPPRARIRLDNLIGLEYRCVFRSAAKPFGIVELCADVVCMKKGNQRFDEVAEIMRRNGL